MGAFVAPLGKFLKGAHRGASGTAPEHTRPALLRALELGADMIEADVQMTADGSLVLFHDLELARTTSGTGRVRDHTLAALKRLDAGAWFSDEFRGEPIMTLEEAVDLVGRQALLNLEIKSSPSDWSGTAAAIVAVLGGAGILDAAVVSCFEMPALRQVRAASRRVRLGILHSRPDWQEVWRWARELEAWSVHPWAPLVTCDCVHRAHELGLRLLPWTVNEAREIGRLVAMGVDGIISDFPDRVALGLERAARL